MRLLSALLIGLLFGMGILVSGMCDPAQVLNFFDVAGPWDPSLAFVMAGGLAVNLVGYRLAFARTEPVLGGQFELPATTPVTSRLLLGAAVFGIGWGLSVFCPGGLLPVLGIGRSEPLLFFAGMLATMYASRHFLQHRTSRHAPRTS